MINGCLQKKNSIFTRTLDYSLEILMKCQNNIHLVSKTEYPHSTNYHSIFLFTHDDTFCHGNRLIQMVVFLFFFYFKMGFIFIIILQTKFWLRSANSSEEKVYRIFAKKPHLYDFYFSCISLSCINTGGHLFPFQTLLTGEWIDS